MSDDAEPVDGAAGSGPDHTGPDHTAPNHAARRGRLRSLLSDEEVDGLVTSHAPNVRYLTGFRGSNGQVLVLPQTTVLLTDPRYEERAQREAPGLEVEIARRWRQRVAEIAAEAGVSRLGFEGAHLSWRSATALREAVAESGGEAVATEELVESLRAVKDDHETGLLARACEITVAAVEALLEDLRPGLTERQVAVRLERSFVDRGAEGRAFPTIVAAGSNGAVPHHEAGDRTLARGDAVTIDCGARVGGYHADMTRTVALGTPPDRLVEVHGIVAQAQAAGRAAAVEGATTGAVDAAARGVIAEHGLGEAFTHPTGHGVGLQIHEEPILRPEGTATITAGTTVTVEPGVYLPGVGGVRIEDTVVVTPDGKPRVLTPTPRDLLTL